MSRTKATVANKAKRSTNAANAKRDRKIDAKAASAKQPAMTRNQQGHVIEAAMQAKPSTVKQLAEKTGFSVSRVQNHVDYEISKKRAKLGKNGVVSVAAAPSYRKQA